MNSASRDYHLVIQSLFLETKGSSGIWRLYFLVKKNLMFYTILFLTCLIGLLCIIPQVTISSSVALINSLIVMLLLAIRFLPLNQPNAKGAMAYNLILVFSLAATILPFFLAVSDAVINTNQKLVDAKLLSIDNFLLGWLYPEGQLSLTLDSSKYFNTSTTIGKYYIEIFVLFYLSYYFWGYLTLVILIRRYINSWRACRGVDITMSLAHLRLYMCAWLCAYYLTFILNYTFPALSPRLYLKDRYKHPLGGTAITKFLIRITSDDMSFGSFPSGHVSETLVVGIFVLRLNRNLGVLILTFALLITISTQVLRYHYFVDVLGAVVVGVISTQFASCLRSAQFTEQVRSLAGLLMLQSITSLNDYEHTDDGSEVVNLDSINYLDEETDNLCTGQEEDVESTASGATLGHERGDLKKVMERTTVIF